MLAAVFTPPVHLIDFILAVPVVSAPTFGMIDLILAAVFAPRFHIIDLKLAILLFFCLFCLVFFFFAPSVL